MLLDRPSLLKFRSEISALGDPLFLGNTSLFLEDVIRNKSRYEVFAVFRNGTVAGFLILSNVAGEAEILEVAVSENMRRRGIASELMEEISCWCMENGIERILLEVRVSNLPARAYYKKYDFAEDGVRKNYYRNPVEDAVLMSKIEKKYDDIESVKLFDVDVTAVYVSDNEENEYVGVEYVDGRFSIVGCGDDCEVSYDEMCTMLYEEI